MSIFESDIFEGQRVGYGMLGLGDVPSGAYPIARLAALRTRFPTLPSEEALRSKSLTHFVLAGAGSDRTDAQLQAYTAALPQIVITFYGEGDREMTDRYYASGAGPVAPAPGPKETMPAPREGDGLLPSPVTPTGMPRWVPVVVVV